MDKRYIASMVLAGVGDAMGYKNGDWEFCFVGEKIHKECEALGGVKKLNIKKPDFIVSDDTVLLLSTAEAMVEYGDKEKNITNINSDRLYSEIAFHYKRDFIKDMNGRASGLTTGNSVHQLYPLKENGWHIKFNERGGGCGAAMRAMCIGLRYPNVSDVLCLEKLIRISVESGRMTHNHPTGYLGSFATALFGALSISKVPLIKWGNILLSLLPRVLAYIEKEGRDVEDNKKHWDYFKTQWSEYLQKRNLLSGAEEAEFPIAYGVAERDAFYKSLAYSTWGGSSGHDAPMIAYDALLFAKDDWVQLCLNGMLHSGDNDSTGVIAGFCYGAMYGLQDVPKCNYSKVEYYDRLCAAGKSLFSLATTDKYLEFSEGSLIPIDKLFQ